MSTYEKVSRVPPPTLIAKRWVCATAVLVLSITSSIEGSTLLAEDGWTMLFNADFDSCRPTTSPSSRNLDSGTSIGSWRAGSNGGTDFGSIIGDGFGNQAIVVDSGLGDARSTNWNTIIGGDFAAIDTRSFAPGEILGASWLWQHTRNSGVETDFLRQVRFTMRNGSTDGVIVLLDLEWAGQADVGYRQAAYPNEVKIYESPGGGATSSNTIRTDGSWNPADAMRVDLTIDSQNRAFLSVDARQDGYDVTNARAYFRNTITTYDNFEISFGGNDAGMKGAIFDDISIAYRPIPESSTAVLCIAGLAGILFRRRR